MKKDNFKASVAYHCKMFIKIYQKVYQKVYQRSILSYCKHFETVLYYENLTPFCYRHQFSLLYYVFIVFNVECHLLMKLLTNTNALHHLLTQLLTNTNSPHTISWYNK